MFKRNERKQERISVATENFINRKWKEKQNKQLLETDFTSYQNKAFS